MMNPTEVQKPASAADTALDASLMAQRRRRRAFLKVSAGVVPVTMTLASRPVRAYSCNTSSAWGSAQINPTASVTARTAAHDLDFSAWTISNWQNNTTGLSSPATQPWNALFALLSPSGSVTSFRNNYTIGDLFGSVLPTGLTAGQKVNTVINATGTTPLQLHLVIAKLNAKLLPTTVQDCLNTNSVDQLTDMLDGAYTTSNGQIWGSAEIIAYLEANGIAVP